MPLTYQEACDLVRTLQKIKPLRTAVIGAWQSDRRQQAPTRMHEHIAYLRTQLAQQRKLLDAADRALDQAEARLAEGRQGDNSMKCTTCGNPICVACWTKRSAALGEQESKIANICTEIKRLASEAVTRDVECDCDGSDPLNYHTKNCAQRREMQRSVRARANRDAYLRDAAPLLVERIEEMSRPKLWPHQCDQLATAWMSAAPRVASFDIEAGSIIGPDNTDPLQPFGECGQCPEWSEVPEEGPGAGVCCCGASQHNGNGRRRDDKPCFEFAKESK